MPLNNHSAIGNLDNLTRWAVGRLLYIGLAAASGSLSPRSADGVTPLLGPFPHPPLFLCRVSSGDLQQHRGRGFTRRLVKLVTYLCRNMVDDREGIAHGVLRLPNLLSELLLR